MYKKYWLTVLLWFVSVSLIQAYDYYYLGWFRYVLFFVGLIINSHYFLYLARTELEKKMLETNTHTNTDKSTDDK